MKSTPAITSEAVRGSQPLLARLSNSFGLVLTMRVAAILLACVASLYLFLSGFTLSYIGIIRNEAVGWVTAVDRAFPFLYVAVLLGNVFTLRPAFRETKTQRVAWAFLLAFSTLGLLLLTRVVRLSQAPGDWRSIVWSAIVLAPLAWIAALDIAGSKTWIKWDTSEDEISLWTPFLSAVFVTSIFLVQGLGRGRELLSGASTKPGIAVTDLVMHLAVFLLGFFCLELIRSLTRSRRFSPGTRFVIWHLVLWLGVGLVLRGIGAPALSFDGPWAWIWALTCAAPLALAIAGLQVRANPRQVPADYAVMLRRMAPATETKRWLLAAVLVVAAIYLPRWIEAVDWNFVFQRFWTVLIWAGALIVIVRTKKRSNGPGWKLACAGFLASLVTTIALANPVALWNQVGQRPVAVALQNYSAMDVSFQVASMVPQSLTWDRTSDEFYALLKRNTLISTQIAAPDLQLADVTAITAAKPNIFIIVVDSLRPDYLSPYNEKVDFTPQIADFARESFVFRNSFTPYGGTGLAEPVVWSGIRIPNQQYIQPFSNVNTLEKLLKAGGYKRYLTRDQVVARLLEHWPNDVDLNQHVSYWTEYDFSKTLTEFESAVLKPHDGPVFLFTQPQNVHAVSIYQRQQAGFPLHRRYPGFRERYAEEVSRFDGLFGEFLAFLKQNGLYENSVIILTADHGDQLGEYGLFGHSASLNPPVIRVPLLVHLPEQVASRFEVDTQAPAFISDIPATLYTVLGVQNLNADPLFGRSLLREPGDRRPAPEDYVLQSSYAPVFAVLGSHGHTLYIADALAKRQSYYRLKEDPQGLRNVIDPEVQEQNQRLISDYIRHLNKVYRFTPGQK